MRGVLLFIGLIIGYLFFFCISSKAPPSSTVLTSSPDKITDELQSCRKELASLKADREKPFEACMVNSPVPHRVKENVNSIAPTVPEIELPRADSRVEWRISAIDKLVNLSDAEKNTLRTAYQGSEPPKLAEIVGPERAKIYSDYVAQTFSKANEEGIQKEVYFISRKLGLTPVQESQILDVYRGVEDEAKQKLSAAGSEEKTGMAKFLEQNQIEQDLLKEKLKNTLPPEQYKAWLLLQADSIDQDLELFHSGPKGKPEDEH